MRKSQISEPKTNVAAPDNGLSRRKMLTLAGAAGISSLGALALRRVARAEQASLRIGMANPVMTVTYPYITSALQLGFFQQEGVKVDVVMGQNSAQILSLLQGGTVDVVFCNPEPLVQLVADRGVNIKSVFIVLEAQYILTVPEDSTIRTIKDLKGKRLGMASPVSGIDYLKARLQDEGMSVADIQIVPTAFGGQTIAAVQQKQVDAIMYWSDALALFRNSGLKLRDLPKADWEKGLYQYLAATTQETIDKKGDALSRALRAMARGQMLSVVAPELTVETFWKQHPDQAPKPSEREKALQQNLARVHQQNRLIGVGDRPTREQLMTHQWGIQSLDAWTRTQNNLLRVGSLKNKVDPNRFFDNRFIEYANRFDRAKLYEMAARAK
ncbi:MAG: ABC transporter substrate-binding protein [Alphaproteobacteria bacterium]